MTNSNTGINLDKLQKIFIHAFPGTCITYLPFIDEVFQQYDISTPLRQCAFLAQIGHESQELHATVENLNYSAEALLSKFGKYFSSSQEATLYARHPEMIANKIYANRMGNGDVQSGDGWKYRGRGLIQVTGKSNYADCGTAINRPYIISQPEFLESPQGATESAGWFWNAHKLNIRSDARDFIGITKVINGGTDGLENRLRLYNLALKVYEI